MPKVNLTKNIVEKIPFQDIGQVLYYDGSLKGFGLRVGRQSKAYFAERRVQGRTVRVTIGPHGPITCDQARKEAQKILGEMVGGSNPNTLKKAERDKGVTLQSAFEDFLKTRPLKDRTVKDYRRAMDGSLSDWKGKRVMDITRDMVASRHRKLGDKIGKAQANQVMRFLRSLMNYCAGAYEDSKGAPLIKFNPLARLSQTGQWFRVPRRQTQIKKHDLPAWYKAVEEIQNDMVRDYLYLLLFSGLRKSEGFKLKKADVDLKGKAFLINDPKNSKPLTLPLPEHLFKILEARVKRDDGSEYVFPGTGGTGHLVEPKKSIAKVIELSGVSFCLHDLRRFFITTAESLDISSFAIKRLVNHAIDAGNVTDGYVSDDVDRLRKPMQQIEDRILKLAKAREPAKIVQLNAN